MGKIMTTPSGRPRIGGQAVMEGVMMNGEHHYTVAVRKQDGNIQSEIFDHSSLTEKGGFYNFPIIRGVIRFAESLSLGIKTLDYSADFYMEEEGKAKNQPKNKVQAKKEKQKETIITGLTLFLAVILAIGLFVALPMFLSRLLLRYVINAPYLIGVLEGLTRMLIFLMYLVLVAQIKDIRRTFEYHGAEHKTINAFEAEVPLTVANVKAHSRYNRRCGTSFLFIIMLISMLIFSFVQITQPLARCLIHLALIPVIAGISYEVLRFSAQSNSLIIRILIAPGLWIQRITTREPDEEEIAVAIASVRKLMETEHPEYLEQDESIGVELFE